MVVRERLCSQGASILYRLCLTSAGGCVAKGARASLAQHFAGGFSHWMEQTGNARIIADGAKREGKECFLKISVAIEKHPLVFQKGCFAREGARKRFPDYGPRRSPALGEVLPHGVRMLLTADRPVAIVIDLHMLRSPSKGDRKVGGEAETDRGTQALGP